MFSDILIKPLSWVGIMNMGLELWPLQIFLTFSRYSGSRTYSCSSSKARDLFSSCFSAQAALDFYQCPQVTVFVALPSAD